MRFLSLTAASLLIASTAFSQSPLDKIKSKAASAYKPKPSTGSTSNLSNEDIVKGLKEALNVGVKNSTARASVVDGYFKNPLIFIPFPKDAQKVEKKLRELGFGKKVDEFTQTLNRAAEEAAKEASPIFLDAVKGMTIQDGVTILRGDNTAATRYLQSKTSAQLTQKFTPVVKNALDKTSATRYWSDLVTIYNKVPGVQKVNPNLTEYATTKAIDGLFFLVGDEETKIRKDPAARITEILKKVFGSKP